MSSGTGYRGGDGPALDDPGAAAERADEIMAGLSAMIEADDPGVLDALRAGQAELEDLAARFAGEYRLLPVFLYYEGIIRQERWGRLGDPADRDAAFDLLLLAAENAQEPDEAVVFALLTAAWDRHAQAPSPRAREAFITWGTRTLGRLAADPAIPPGDEDVLLLRRQLALMLGDRAEAGDGDRLADLDRACDLLALAVESTPEPDPEVVSQLIEAASERYVQDPSARARDTLITWATWLFDEPAGQREPAGPFTGERLTHLRMQLALFLNDRADADEGNQVTDLTAAIGHYEAVLATRPAGQPERAEVLSFVTHAYWDLIWASGSRDEWLDRMTEHAREAWTAPGLPEPARALVGLCLGLGLREQFSRPGPPPAAAEMNLAVGALSAVLPELRDEDPELALMAETELGMVLAGRGQLTGDLESMREAEGHLLNAGSQLRPDHPLWPGAVGSLAAAETVLAMAGLGASHSDQAVTLLRALADQPSADQERAAVIDQGLSAVLLSRTAGRRGPDADEGMKYLKAAFEKAPTGSSVRVATAQNLSGELATRFFTGGSRQDLQAAQFYLDVVDEAMAAGPPGALAEAFPDTDMLLAGVRGQVAIARGTADGDVTAIRAGVEHLREAVRLAGPHHQRALRLRSDLGLALLLRYMYAGEDPADLRDGAGELEAAAALLPAEHPMRNMTLFRAATAELLLGLRHRDRRLLRTGIDRLIQVRAGWGSGPGDPFRVTALLANAHAELWGLSRDPADLAAARDWYAAAAAEFDQQPGHAQHGPLLIGLARLELRAGARKAAVRAGLAALRARARDVLVQAGPANGLVTARIAAAEAAEVARWCLDDGITALAVEALELGRGLVLHAATSTADLPERLTAAGQPDLASEWRQLAGQPAADEPWDGVADPGFGAGLLRAESLAVPSDLRERTLRVLADDALVTPPTCREIAAALARNGADALVYLVPSADASQVHALLVPAAGEPRAVPLPRGTSDPLDEFAAAQARLLAAPPVTAGDADADDAGAPPPGSDAAEAEWRDKLDPLCEWAWTAVVGPLLEEVPRPAPGAVPRLVLVPVGRLGVVPWHAACRPAPDGGRRYAVADAVFSYAASGRQLAEVSRRRALPLTSDPVIVAPEVADLTFAPVEAAALRGLYPGARYLGPAAGGQADGPARPRDVLAVLPADQAAGASMLHLICHAMATNAGAEASHLLLADDQELTVKAILRQASGRPAAAPGGLVDLAGCRTHLTAADHDEALTLSTAFLAAGAVTVVGSRWDLPDAPSAVLMFMFHHYLVATGLRPADALRAAQLWMLDPERQSPPSMPPELRDWRWGLDRVLAWAGLTHQGQ